MAQKKSIYIGDKMAAVLGPCGDDTDITLSGRINQVAERYAATLRRAGLPEFSAGELDLLRNLFAAPSMEDAERLRGVWMRAEDSIKLDGSDRLYQVDGAALVEKLKTLRYDQELALIEAVEQWWRSQK